LINDFNKSLKHYVLIGFLTISSAVFASPNHDVFVAVGRDDSVGLRKALNAGADLNGWSQHQETALTLSLRLGSQRVLKALMAFRELDINRANGAGETPLMLAAIQAEAVWLCRLLLRGAYVNHPGWTALHYACSHNKAGGAGHRQNAARSTRLHRYLVAQRHHALDDGCGLQHLGGGPAPA